MDIKEIKVVLLAIKEQIATVLSDNCKIKNDLLTLKESMNAKDRELTRMKEQLAEITSRQNNSLKNELNSARLKLNQQQEDIDNMWWSQDNLEQYSRKNSQELHGIPYVAYGLTEEAVIKVTNALNLNVRSEDINISHRIQRKHSDTIIVKFASPKIKSRVYKARTGLKNLTLTSLFPARPSESRTESNRIHMCENLTAHRRHLVNKANAKRRNNEILNVLTMDGKVFVKTSPEGSAIRIQTQEDLDNL